jgi:hypothetical protein
MKVVRDMLCPATICRSLPMKFKDYFFTSLPKAIFMRLD